MGDEHDGLAGLEPDPFHFGPHARAHVGIERRERLVHQHDLGIDRERAGDRDPLALAAREHGRVFARIAGEPDEGQELACARPAPLPVASAEAQFRAEQHVIERGAPGNQPRRLEHEGDLRPGVARRTAVDGDAADAHVEQAADDPQRGRFAATGRSEDANELAAADVEAQPVIDLLFAKSDADIFKCDDRVGSHARLADIFSCHDA